MKSIWENKSVQVLGGWITVGTFIYGLLAAALAWLTKHTPEWFGLLTWPKAILIGLVAAIVLILFLALALWLAAQAVRVLRATGPLARPTGDRLAARGTVRDTAPSEQLARDLYVGRIEINVDRLQSDHVLEIAVLGFNGTENTISYSRTSGSVGVSISGNPEVAFRLRPPTVLAERSNPDSLAKRAEFLLVFEQSLRPDAVDWLAEQLQRERILFDLDTLDIMMEVRGEGASARLPLWDGVTVFWREGFQTSRLTRIALQDTISASSTVG